MHPINKRISLILKELRHGRGWSLDMASQKTGVSKAMLGQIEREESSPTIATLWKIASGFDVSFSSFIEDVEMELNKPVHRIGHTQQIHPTDEKIRVLSLFPFEKELNFEMFVIELLPTCEHLSPPHQSGVIEHVIVVTGAMEVFVNGKWQLVHQGEGLRFQANQPHGYRNFSDEMAVFHDIIHYQSN
jgi:transcriptional regulator with XRE-family HTH domain